MRLIKRLEKSSDFWFLVSFNILFFFLRLPSLFEPYWYGDEGIYQAIGLALRNGEVLYKDIWDNKTPAIYYLYGLLGSDQFLTKLASLIFGIIGIIFFFLLAKKMLIKVRSYRISTLIFSVLFGLPLIEGNIANAENFMIPLIIMSAYLVYKSTQEKRGNKTKQLALAGLILGLSFLFKIVSIFDFAAFCSFLLIYDFPEKINIDNILKQIKIKLSQLFIFGISFLFPFFLTVVYFSINHILKLYLSSIFLSNVGYVGYGNNFIIPQGLLILKLILLSIALILIFIKRKAIKFDSALFVLVWLSFSFFNVFFSQRGYPHYVLVLIPAFCLLFGSIFIYNKFSKGMVLIFIGSFLVILHFFSFYWKSIDYYKNFLAFVLDHKSVNSYQSFFDGNTPRDYEISMFIKSEINENDKIFIWGNNAQVYKLTDKVPPAKYTVAYHITQYPDGLSSTKDALRKTNPKIIVIMPNVSPYPFSLYNYQIAINIGGALIYERDN